MSTVPTNIIVLNSRDRTAGTPQSCTYNLLNVGGVQGTFELLGFHSANMVYNVEAGVNDTIYWDEVSGSKTAVVPPGFYTSATFNAAAKVVMDIASTHSFTFTTAADTGLVTVAISSGTFLWEWGTRILNGDSANELLGLAPVDTLAAASQEGTLPPYMRLHTHLVLRLQEEGSRNVDLLDGTELSLIVPLQGSFGEPINNRKGDVYGQTFRFLSNITQLNVDLFTEDGSALGNCPEYVLTIRKVFD